ncbi:hypothetical protein RWE15_12865 [Virgibacillus halophilus]|uniref:Uncharacterized protein n=1 Tax=Tigheibacillus halophilus TaxID=361280 RepID=A0ABU5C773_9BACI|nr:hypothetical protein [Virgibacillus halophilus]
MLKAMKERRKTTFHYSEVTPIDYFIVSEIIRGELTDDPYIQEAAEIYHYYTEIESSTLQMIRYRMIKEKNGAGVIPVLVAAIPWLLFLFSKQLQEFLFQEGSLWWLLFLYPLSGFTRWRCHASFSGESMGSFSHSNDSRHIRGEEEFQMKLHATTCRQHFN